MGSLGLEAVLVGDVTHLDHFTLGVGVLVLALGYLGFLLGLAGVLEETLLLRRYSVSGFVAEDRTATIIYLAILIK